MRCYVTSWNVRAQGSITSEGRRSPCISQVCLTVDGQGKGGRHPVCLMAPLRSLCLLYSIVMCICLSISCCRLSGFPALSCLLLLLFILLSPPFPFSSIQVPAADQAPCVCYTDILLGTLVELREHLGDEKKASGNSAAPLQGHPIRCCCARGSSKGSFFHENPSRNPMLQHKNQWEFEQSSSSMWCFAVDLRLPCLVSVGRRASSSK